MVWRGAEVSACGGAKVVGARGMCRPVGVPRRCRAQGGGAKGGPGGDAEEPPVVMSEEVLNRLQEAEKEAAELRKQLADMKSAEESSASTSGRPNRPEIKVDSVSTRENFLYPQSDVWLGGKPRPSSASRCPWSRSAWQPKPRPVFRPCATTP